eukprot:32343-Chlamydomonas_euryale.AAC.1
MPRGPGRAHARRWHPRHAQQWLAWRQDQLEAERPAAERGRGEVQDTRRPAPAPATKAAAAAAAQACGVHAPPQQEQQRCKQESEGAGGASGGGGGGGGAASPRGFSPAMPCSVETSGVSAHSLPCLPARGVAAPALRHLLQPGNTQATAGAPPGARTRVGGADGRRWSSDGAGACDAASRALRAPLAGTPRARELSLPPPGPRSAAHTSRHNGGGGGGAAPQLSAVQTRGVPSASSCGDSPLRSLALPAGSPALPAGPPRSRVATAPANVPCAAAAYAAGCGAGPAAAAAAEVAESLRHSQTVQPPLNPSQLEQLSLRPVRPQQKDAHKRAVQPRQLALRPEALRPELLDEPRRRAAQPGSRSPFGTDIPRDGSDVPRDGSEVPWDGSEVPRDGSEVPRDGSEVSREGSAMPRYGSRVVDRTVQVFCKLDGVDMGVAPALASASWRSALQRRLNRAIDASLQQRGAAAVAHAGACGSSGGSGPGGGGAGSGGVQQDGSRGGASSGGSTQWTASQKLFVSITNMSVSAGCTMVSAWLL